MSLNSRNLCKLFDIVFHQILYINNVYVRRSFECLQLSSIQIWKCMHPGVSGYLHKFLSVAQEHFDQCQPLQIVFVLKKYPDIVLDEYIFHVHPKQLEMSRSELDRNIVDIVQSLQAVALEHGENSVTDNEELTFSLQIRKEEPDLQFPTTDENSAVVFINTNEEEAPRIIPLRRIKRPDSV